MVVQRRQSWVEQARPSGAMLLHDAAVESIPSDEDRDLNLGVGPGGASEDY